MSVYSRFEMLKRQGAVVRHHLFFGPPNANRLFGIFSQTRAGKNQPGLVFGPKDLGSICGGCVISRGEVPGVTCTTLLPSVCNPQGETIWGAEITSQLSGKTLPLAVRNPGPGTPTVQVGNHDYFMANGLVPPCQSAREVRPNLIL